MSSNTLDFIPKLREAQIQGYRYVTEKLDEFAKKNGLAEFNEPSPVWAFHRSVSVIDSCVSILRSHDLISLFDKDICPWTLGFINGRENGHLLLTLAMCKQMGEHALDFIVSLNGAVFRDRWAVDVVNEVKVFHQLCLTFIDHLERPSIDQLCSKLSPDGRESLVVQAMLQLDCTDSTNRRSQKDILHKAYRGKTNDNRRVFKKLVSLGLICKGENGRGYYLSQSGIEVASKMSAP